MSSTSIRYWSRRRPVSVRWTPSAVFERSRRLSGLHCGEAKLPEHRRQNGKLMIRVEPARVRQHPQAGGANPLRLSADDRSRSAERRAVGAETDYGNPSRFVASHFSLERATSRDKLFIAQLGCSGCCSPNERRYAISRFEQQVVFPWSQNTLGEPSGMKRRPEAISGTREMQPRRTGVQAGVDPAEENGETWRDKIADRPPRRPADLFCCRPPWR